MSNIQNTVSVEQGIVLLKEMVKRNKSTMIWGSMGIGKTEGVRQVARELSMGYRSFLGSIKQPVDLAGLPVPDLANGTTIWLRPCDLPNVERDGPTGIFHMDEINTSPPSMQAAMFQLVLERRVGEHKLPDGWVPVASGNRVTDRAAAQRMPTALRNRFGHFNWVPELNGWKTHAIRRGVHPHLIDFLSFRPGLLHVPPEGEQNSFPTPRSWVEAADFIDLSPELRQPLVASEVGEGPAAELEGFLRIVTSVPKLPEILSDPKSAKVPTDPAGKYAVAGLLSRSADRKNLGTLVTYANRLGREFEVLTVVDAVKRNPDLSSCKSFADWAVENQDVRI